MRKRLMAMVLLTALVLSACSGTSDADSGIVSLEDAAETSSTTTVADETIDEEQAVIDLVECLREEGLDVADPEVDSEGNVDIRGLFRQAEQGEYDEGEVEAAMEACATEADAVRVGFTRDFDLTDIEDQLLAFAACMRDNGYDMPDPDLSNFGPGGSGGGSGGGGMLGDLDEDDPDFQAALAQCQDFLPGVGPGSGLGGGTP